MLGRARRVVDCGANRGVYTYWLARHAGRVEAFEPNPALAIRLRAAGLSNVTVHGAALSDHAGVATLLVPYKHGGGLNDPGGTLETRDSNAAMARFETPLCSLDAQGFVDLDFIKIDVEGHEEKVLAGAWQTIATQHPALLIELEERHNPGCLQRVALALAALGYRAYFLDEDRWQDVGALVDASGQRSASGRYINNFLFVADGRLG